MPYGLYVSATGADAQSRYIQVLSNNLANADTPGFKPDFAVVRARHSEAIEQGLDQPGSRSINDIGGGVTLQESATNFQAGTLKRTGSPTDLAIEDGDGSVFFVVEQEGEKMLTRAGNFRFSADGQLQNQDGHPVLSADGATIQLDPRIPWHVTPDGAIQQQGNRVPLALESPQSLGDLVKVGQNQFRPLADTTAVTDDRRRVRQGHLEMSAVKPVQMMVDLIKATRAYESNIRMIQNQDQMISSLVNRVLRQT